MPLLFLTAWAAWRYGATHPPTMWRMVSPGPLSTAHAFLDTSCTTCHTPGVGIERTSCVGCHSREERLLGRQPTAFHATITTCRSCHVEHDATRRRPIIMDHAVLGLLDTSSSRRARPPEQTLDCASCHSTKDRHRGLFGNDCASCHGISAWTIPGYVHPSPKSVNCAQCHQAPPSHFMMHFEMVSKVVARKPKATVGQCYACHQTTAWNDIVGVGWYKHH